MARTRRPTKLEAATQDLVVLKTITSATGSLSDRAKRMYEKAGEEAYRLYKQRNRLPKNSGLILNIRWSNDAASWARNMTLAINEFSQAHPEYGEILARTIEKHREVRRAYVEFGVRKGDLPAELYIDVIKQLTKTSDEKASQIYNAICLMQRPKKAGEGLPKLLLPE